MTRERDSGSDTDTAAGTLEYLRQLRGDDEDDLVGLRDVPTVAHGGSEPAAGPMIGNLAGGAPDTAPVVSDTAHEWTTCPECGESAMIDPSRRRAEDFCSRCDFPLFWARSSVVAMLGTDTGASLRRLPGTVGRSATASVACPHCGEPNAPTATECVRCGLPMVLLPPAPEPEPVFVAPPPAPEPEPEPEPEFPAGWVIAICMTIVVVVIVLAVVFQYR